MSPPTTPGSPIPVVRIIGELEASLKKYPPIKVGTPDPYCRQVHFKVTLTGSAQEGMPAKGMKKAPEAQVLRSRYSTLAPRCRSASICSLVPPPNRAR